MAWKREKYFLTPTHKNLLQSCSECDMMASPVRQSGLARTNTEKIMVITPAMTDATWALLMAMMDDAGNGEKFLQLPPMEQAHIMTSQIVRNRLMDIVRDALQAEADYLAGQ
jgi:hypothetical protein